MQDKNLRFCIDQLKSLQNRNGLKPEQESELEKAMKRLRRLWRKHDPSRKEIYQTVRQVAEAVLKTFEK